MDIKKLLIGAVVAFAVMFLLGYLWHVVLMADFYQNNPGEIGAVDRETPMLFYIGLGYLSLSLVMAYIYPKGAEGDSHIMDGIKFGAIMGFLWIVPLSSVLYGATIITSKTLVLGDGLYHIVEGAIGGALIAMVYGKRNGTPTAASSDSEESNE